MVDPWFRWHTSRPNQYFGFTTEQEESQPLSLNKFFRPIHNSLFCPSLLVFISQPGTLSSLAQPSLLGDKVNEKTSEHMQVTGDKPRVEE